MAYINPGGGAGPQPLLGIRPLNVGKLMRGLRPKPRTAGILGQMQPAPAPNPQGNPLEMFLGAAPQPDPAALIQSLLSGGVGGHAASRNLPGGLPMPIDPGMGAGQPNMPGGLQITPQVAQAGGPSVKKLMTHLRNHVIAARIAQLQHKINGPTQRRITNF